MTATGYKCDDCGDTITGEVFSDYDRYDRCEKCYLKNEIADKTRQWKKTLEWLKITHIKDVKNSRKEVKELKQRLSDIS